MSSTVRDFRLGEEMAGAVLKQVAALEPRERLQEADSLSQILGQAMQDLEELWEQLRQPLQSGVSPADAATLGRILNRSANLIGSSLELLVGENLSLVEFRESSISRLHRIKARAASLRRFVDMPAPAADPQRLRTSMEQLQRGEGIDAEDILTQAKG